MSERSNRSKYSPRNGSRRHESTESEESKYVIDGPFKDLRRFDGTTAYEDVNETIVSRNEKRGTIQDCAVPVREVGAGQGVKHRSAALKNTIAQTAQKPAGAPLATGSAIDGSNYSLAVTRLHDMPSASDSKAGRKMRNVPHSNVKTQRGSQYDVRAATKLSHNSSRESCGTESIGRRDEMIGSGLMEGQSRGEKAKYSLLSSDHHHQTPLDKGNDSRGNLR